VFGAVARATRKMALLPSRGEKEAGHVVVEKVRPVGTETLGVRREIELAAENAGFELHGAIAAIAKALQNGAQSARKKMSTAASAGSSCSRPR